LDYIVPNRNYKPFLSAVVLALIALTGLPVKAQDFWGMHAPGITDRIIPVPVLFAVAANEKVLYLTLDACGGGYNAAIITFLRTNKIPATLFINARWIDANPETFADLAADPLFKIANHGMMHRPASVRGKSAYGIKGTKSKEELLAEINGASDKIEALTGSRPKWYRSGTAHYDAESIRIITKDLSMKIAGFARNLDGGATFSAYHVYRVAMTSQPGDILIAHMNKPTRAGGTASGLARAIPEMKKQGYIFRQLPD